MWPAIIILGLLLIYISGMCRAAGRPMPMPAKTAQQRAQREKIAMEEQHDQTHHQTDLADHQGRIPVDEDPHLAQKPRSDLAPVNSVAAYAYQALDRAIQTKGEK